MRILLSLHEVAGYYSALKNGFDQNGIKADFIPLNYHRFEYSISQNNAPWISRPIRYVSRKIFFGPNILWKFLLHLLRILFFIYSVFRYDVFIFGFGITFFSPFPLKYLDLWILKKLNKKIIFQFHGSDSRPPYINGFLISKYNFNTKTILNHTRMTYNLVKVVNKYATNIIDIPPQGYFHSRKYINWMIVGLPNGWDENYETKIKINERIKILHCPSRLLTKGSELINRIIIELKEDGYLFDFIQITGKPNSVVHKELEKCDFVIDQAYADYGMPGFACEAAWKGKPVIIAGNSVKLWDSILTDELKLPAIYCSIDNLKYEIEKLLSNPVILKRHAQNHLRFVKENWHPTQIANKYISIINDNYPKDWELNPKDFTELNGGYFMPTVDIKNFLNRYLSEFGDGALMLEDKPELVKSIKKFLK